MVKSYIFQSGIITCLIDVLLKKLKNIEYLYKDKGIEGHEKKMKIESLRYFISVADNLSFTKAAAEQHMTQTAMSKHIAALESETGARLFIRDNRRVQLTPMGRQFYEDIIILLKNYDEAMKNLHLINEGLPGFLRIGIGAYEHIILSPALQEFRLRYPAYQALVSQYLYGTLWEEAKNNNFDIIFIHPGFFDYVDKERFKIYKLFSFEYFLLVNKKDPLSCKPYVTRADLRQQKIFTLSETSGTSSNGDLKYAGVKGGLVSKEVVPVNGLNSLLAMIKAGYGVSFAPHFIEPFLPEEVAMVRQSIYKRDKYIAMVPVENQNPATSLFVNILTKTPSLWQPFDVTYKWPELLKKKVRADLRKTKPDFYEE